MISIRILKKQNEGSLSLVDLMGISLQMEEVLESNLERTSIYDPNFEGYYITSYDEIISDKKFLTKKNYKRLFILGIPHIFISDIIKKLSPMGLTQLRFTGKDKTSFFAPEDFMIKNNFDTIFNYEGYLMSRFSELKDTPNALAQSIIKYITMYDEFIKGN